MARGITLLALSCAILAGGNALAGGIDLGGGWRANWPPPDGSIDIRVDQITPDYMIIEISKDFYSFDPRLIDFIQVAPDNQTVPRIIITDETVSNISGQDWTDYHWTVTNSGDAWFNVPLSSGFDVSPFASKQFSDPFNVFNDPNKATDLDAFNGVVPAWDTFFPGVASGELVLDVDLSGAEPVSFLFRQFPTPEPGTALLVGLGALLLRRR